MPPRRTRNHVPGEVQDVLATEGQVGEALGPRHLGCTAAPGSVWWHQEEGTKLALAVVEPPDGFPPRGKHLPVHGGAPSSRGPKRQRGGGPGSPGPSMGPSSCGEVWGASQPRPHAGVRPGRRAGKSSSHAARHRSSACPEANLSGGRRVCSPRSCFLRPGSSRAASGCYRRPSAGAPCCGSRSLWRNWKRVSTRSIRRRATRPTRR